MADVQPTTAPTSPSTNGVKPGAAQTPVTPPTQSAPATPDELTTTRERLKSAEAAAERAKRDEIVRARQWSREKQTFGEKLKQADEYERLKREARINKGAVAQKLWGEKWRDELMAEEVNGGVPSRESVAYELEQRDRSWEEKLAAREAEQRKAQEDATQRSLQAQIKAFRAELTEEAKTKAGDYPIFGQFKTPDALGDTLMRYIQNEVDRTTQKDSETGEIVRHGRVMSFKEAAEALESDMLAIADNAFGHEKYAPKFRERLQPQKPSGTVPNVAKSSQSVSQGSQSVSQPRKTLSNDLTGSTPSDAPRYRSEEQRRQDALARYAEAARKS